MTLNQKYCGLELDANLVYAYLIRQAPAIVSQEQTSLRTSDHNHHKHNTNVSLPLNLTIALTPTKHKTVSHLSTYHASAHLMV